MMYKKQLYFDKKINILFFYSNRYFLITYISH